MTEFIAHRAGNDESDLRAAEHRADVIEVDVHLGKHAVVEARHGKRLWPTQRLWERWYLLPADTPTPTLDSIFDAASADTVFWLDLKGPDPRLSRRIAATVGRRPLTVSTKAWWQLRPFLDESDVRTIRSAGNRTELLALFIVLRLFPRSKVDGSVVHSRLLTPSVVARLKRFGPLFTWAIPDAGEVERLLDLGVDGLILDDLGLIP